MASIAYSLQVGVKRHAGGSNGEIQRLYPRNNHNANFVSMVNLPFTPLLFLADGIQKLCLLPHGSFCLCLADMKGMVLSVLSQRMSEKSVHRNNTAIAA